VSANPGELKAALRRKLRAEFQRHSAVEMAADSAQIRVQLAQQDLWRKIRSILFYVPLPGEPDLWPLVAEALNAEKIVTLPRYVASEDQYVACSIKDTVRDLRPGQYGILEPLDSCPPFDLNQLDLAIVPGIGFTLNGYRLGRGKGYYDRLLAKVSGIKCGVAFDWQTAVELAPEPHDIRLNYILTPTLWHHVRSEGGIL